MKESELIKDIASQANISHADAKRALRALSTSISKALKNNDKVNLRGIGVFATAKRNARKGRNPKTGEQITIKEKKVVRFKAGSKLKNVI